MRHRGDIGRYLPSIYNNVLETDEITAAENETLLDFYRRFDSAYGNQFVVTADLDGLKAFEDIYGIKANPDGEDMEFRRQRILARASLRQPFSVRYLRGKLDTIIGAGKYEIHIDFNSYTLYIDAAAQNANWYGEIAVLMTRIKPCNMVYISRPLIESGFLVGETIEAMIKKWNYRLGTTWQLGALPFAHNMNSGEVKPMAQASITAEFLSSIATFAVSDIKKVRINASYEITSFSRREAEGNIGIVEYMVNPQSGLNAIEKVELLGDGDKALSRSDIYVPLIDPVMLRHKFPVREALTNG